MGIEIERKFLVCDDRWRHAIDRSEHFAQGYLVGAQALHAGYARASVRVRISREQAWLNIKAAQLGIERSEYEYLVPLADAKAMLNELCDGVLEKIRHYVVIDGVVFEIDDFLGANQGLIVAEIELASTSASFPRPAWLGKEVSHLSRYYNVHLLTHPYLHWSDEERSAMDAGPSPC